MNFANPIHGFRNNLIKIFIKGEKMANFKMKGNDLFDNLSHKIASIKGNDIFDSKSHKVASVKGSDVFDEHSHKIASLTDIKKLIADAAGGTTVAALWFFFVR